MKRYIFLIRHGETEYGVEKRYLGHTDCRLSEEGIRQAGQLADLLLRNPIPVNQIFSSDLLRCRETIKIIFPEREITYLEELREINMGAWEGLTLEEVRLRYPKAYEQRGLDIAGYTPKNGESFLHCQKRAGRIFQSILDVTEGNIAICTHAGFLRVLLCSLLKMDISRLFELKINYASITIITCEAEEVCVEAINRNDFRTGYDGKELT